MTEEQEKVKTLVLSMVSELVPSTASSGVLQPDKKKRPKGGADGTQHLKNLQHKDLKLSPKLSGQ